MTPMSHAGNSLSMDAVVDNLYGGAREARRRLAG